MANVQDQPTTQIVEALRAVLCQVAGPDAVLKEILRQAVVRTVADRGLFAEVLDNGAMEYRVMQGFKADHFEGNAGAFSRNLFHRVVESGEDVVLDCAADDPYWNTIRSVRSLQTSAVLCMPIWIGNRVAAVVHLENRRAGHFGSDHRELLRSLLTVAGPVMETMREVLRERDALRRQTDSLRQEADESRALLAHDWSFGRFVGRSAVVRRLESSVRRAAETEFPILLLGETGTGKNILARVIHHSGRRAKRPFVTAFCPSLERGMVEAELFGHSKGAFTTALTDRTGKVQAANGGTLFMDEIGELPLEIQPKLLRFLNDGTFERVGESREQTADVRVIAATNKNLEAEVKQGFFRRDLFERLNFLPIQVPPLRERREDIPLLLRCCLDRTESGRWVDLTPEAVEFLERHESRWLGNVRHVEQLAARLVAEGGEGPVSAQDVERLLGPDSGQDGEEDPDSGLKERRDDAERAWIVETIQKNPGLKRTQLAEKLGISPAALFVKLRKYGIRHLK